jgi:hypothetical protein
MQNFQPPFWKIHITPHVIQRTLLHPLEIWLVAFKIYDICKFKHILSQVYDNILYEQLHASVNNWHMSSNLSDIFVCLMVFNATFKTISVISWRSVVLMVYIFCIFCKIYVKKKRFNLFFSNTLICIISYIDSLAMLKINLSNKTWLKGVSFFCYLFGQSKRINCVISCMTMMDKAIV